MMTLLLLGCQDNDQDRSVSVKKDVNITEVPLVIHGHTLPPDPGEEGKKTLLGIDVNNNGVRDDVERWIYMTYDTYIPCHYEPIEITLDNGEKAEAFEKVCEKEPVEYHQIVREIAMQGARAAQIIIQEPEKARETTHLMQAAQDCNFYFMHANDNNESNLIDHHIFNENFFAIQYNTVKRVKEYAKYNFTLSGGVFKSPKNQRKECSFDIDALLGKNMIQNKEGKQ